MRLLHTTTLQVDFFAGQVPEYATLSHRWEEGEITFDDIRSGRNLSQQKGLQKLQQSAQIAKAAGHEYIWIDTCCIDKSSSAELSEAINSMFQWYRNATECITYLSDIEEGESILESRWFTRGWTLQELLAPKQLSFYDRNWKLVGSRQSWKKDIYKHRGIPPDVLDGTTDLREVSVCCKMSWAANRVTTRAEDLAYCLLGIFKVNMPLLYGEGQDKAFRRLQETIVKETDDESIFAWSAPPEEATKVPYWGLLAPSPSYFQASANYTIPRYKTWRSGDPPEVTNRGLRLSLSLLPLPRDESKTQFLAILNCSRSRESPNAVENSFTLTVQKLSQYEDQYARVRPDIIEAVNEVIIENQSHVIMPHIYVRFTPIPANPVLGFCIDKDLKVEFDFPTNSFQGPKILKGYVDVQMGGTKPWNCQKITDSRDVYSVELDEPGQGQQDNGAIGGNPRARVVGAIIKLSCQAFLKEEAEGPFPARCSPMVARLEYQDPYLFVGLEPPPPNGTGTPSGFLRPWYAFIYSQEPKVIQEMASTPASRNQIHTTPGHCQFGVTFNATTLNFRTFYEMRLVNSGIAAN